jgi:hypothetical protein
MTKGVKKHRKWLKHLWSEGQRIIYMERSAIEAMDSKGQSMLSAYIERKLFGETKYVRLVPGRMAEGIWRKRDRK